MTITKGPRERLTHVVMLLLILPTVFLWPGRSSLSVTPSVDEVIRQCESCHAPDRLAGNTPRLNGQLFSYLKESLDDLVVNNRFSQVPNHIPKSLSPSDIHQIAGYYAGMAVFTIPNQTVPIKVKEGEIAYLEQCSGCHGEYGRESDNRGLGAPFLAGQNLGYLRLQTENFSSGKRLFSISQMEKAFATLTPASREAIAHFFAAQPPVLAVPARKGRRRRE